MEVLRIDEHGQAVRTPQWIIELEAPVDVAALLREHEDAETALVQAPNAVGVLQRAPATPVTEAAEADRTGAGRESPCGERPSLDQVLAHAKALGIAPARFVAYADGRWGTGWRLSPHGRARAWEELDRHRNDPLGYRDKLDVALQSGNGRRAS